MLVDSSVLLEVLLGLSQADRCLKEMGHSDVYIPAVAYYECYKKLRHKVSESEALEAMASLEAYATVEITREIALLAGDLAIEHGLAMADSLVLACAYEKKIPLLTLDNDFSRIPGTKVLRSRL